MAVEGLTPLGVLAVLTKSEHIPDSDVFEGESGWLAVKGDKMYFVSRHTSRARVSEMGRWEDLEVI